MPSFENRTARSTMRTATKLVRARLGAIAKAAADFIAHIGGSLAPAPVLQPIPVRVRARRPDRR